MINNPKIDKIQIRNMLTLRYDPRFEPAIGKKTAKHMLFEENDFSGKKTEKLLKHAFKVQFGSNTESKCVSLSSGIDSSLSLAILRELYPTTKITALCGVFDENNNESKIAKIISKKFDADFKIIKMPSIFKTMAEIIWITKKPRWNTYTHIISKEAKKFNSVLVTGDGADEIFGGYIFRYSKFLKFFKKNDNWKTRTKNYLECHNRDWVPDQKTMFGTSIKFSWDYIYNYFKKYFSGSLHPLKQVFLADFNGKLLYDFIPTSKAICKYYDIEHFSPFLNSNMINFGMSIPLNQKYCTDTNMGKIVLRKIAKRYEIPHIDNKQGFSPSLWNDWEKNGKKIFESLVMTEKANIFKQKLIDYNWVVSSFEGLSQDGNIRYLNRLISILALEIWYKMVILKEFDQNHKLGKK